MPRTSTLRRLYEWEPLRAPVEAVLDRGPVHRLADPYGALSLVVMGDGDELQWHFDQTDVVVSPAIKTAGAGGDFEVHPRIRTVGDERYDDVAEALAGERRGVVTLPMVPGTLLVFEGRHPLHRVGPVGGGKVRHVGLPGLRHPAGHHGQRAAPREPLRSRRAVPGAAGGVACSMSTKGRFAWR